MVRSVSHTSRVRVGNKVNKLLKAGVLSNLWVKRKKNGWDEILAIKIQLAILHKTKKNQSFLRIQNSDPREANYKESGKC